MTIELKLFFTIALVALVVVFWFVDPKTGNAGHDWFWRGGRNDIVRNLVCREDGTLRRHTKLFATLLWAGGILMLWLVVPSS